MIFSNSLLQQGCCHVHYLEQNPMKHICMLASVLAFLTHPTLAHVTANPDKAVAGTYFQTSFRITHGCADSATTAVHIKIPAGVLSVHPQFKPGWDMDVSKLKLEEPVVSGHGTTIDEAVDEVVWQGNRLPSDQYDDFGLVMKLPDSGKKTLWFPVIQKCESGENKWVEIPTTGQQWHSLNKPAPFVVLSAPSAK